MNGLALHSKNRINSVEKLMKSFVSIRPVQKVEEPAAVQKKKAPSTVSVHAIMLMGYDLVMLAIVSILLLVFYPSSYYPITRVEALMHYLLAAACMLGCRAIGDSYNNVWRYGGNNLYVNLICYDALAGAVYYVIQKVLPLRDVEFLRAVTLFALNLLGDILMRQIYQYLYDANSRGSKAADFLRVVTQKLTGIRVEPEDKAKRDRRINIAIIGAGRVGAGLAADLASNPDAAYTARFFVDIDRNKIGRSINGVPVFSEEEANSEAFRDYNIQEIVFAIPGATAERKKELYTYYKQTGCKLKTYDYPTTQSVNGKRSLRDFDAEELLFRQATEILSEDTKAYYRGKTVLISGGGGSIGSELCRQIAKIGPKRLVVLDVYENGAYDVQQELKIKHGKNLDLCVEIVTITDKGQLERVFRTHRPDVVIHAAAHKHVPLMEDNCCEAVKNNVFGTRNLLDVAESCAISEKAKASLQRLRRIYELLTFYGYEKYITFDLGVVSKYQYYTGIIFQAYTYGTGEPIAKGGRYDTLMDHFGKPAPAIGFVCVADRLLTALNRQNIKLDVDRPLTLLLYYPEESRKAIACAGELRSQGGPVELCCMAQDRTVDTYRDYASRKGTNRLCYYKDGNLVAEFLSTEQ